MGLLSVVAGDASENEQALHMLYRACFVARLKFGWPDSLISRIFIFESVFSWVLFGCGTLSMHKYWVNMKKNPKSRLWTFRFRRKSFVMLSKRGNFPLNWIWGEKNPRKMLLTVRSYQQTDNSPRNRGIGQQSRYSCAGSKDEINAFLHCLDF